METVAITAGFTGALNDGVDMALGYKKANNVDIALDVFTVASAGTAHMVRNSVTIGREAKTMFSIGQAGVGALPDSAGAVQGILGWNTGLGQ